MRSARIHNISESEHFVDYAEYPHIELWEQKVERRMKKDTDAKWQLWACLLCAGWFFIVYVVPMIIRWLR